MRSRIEHQFKSVYYKFSRVKSILDSRIKMPITTQHLIITSQSYMFSINILILFLTIGHLYTFLRKVKAFISIDFLLYHLVWGSDSERTVFWTQESLDRSFQMNLSQMSKRMALMWFLLRFYQNLFIYDEIQTWNRPETDFCLKMGTFAFSPKRPCPKSKPV